IKFDHQLFQWWRASLSYLKYNSDEPGENPYPTISSPDQWLLGRKVDATQINNTITPSSTWVVAVRYGFNRFPNIGTQKSQNFNVASLGFANSFVRDIASPSFPNVTMQTVHNLGTNNNFNYVHHSKNFGFAASKFLGKHSFKFGYDFRRLSDDGLDYGNSAGAFTFDNRFTRANSNSTTSASGADIADLLLGAPAGATGFIPTKLFQYVDYHALFLQDDFRVSAKLTLNLGLRWERETGLREVNNNIITGFDGSARNPISVPGTDVLGVFRFAGVDGQKETTGSPKMNKFSPRVGFAYQLNSKTVLRGGWGFFWAPMFSLGSPFNSEGITATTAPSISNDGNKTPAVSLSNPFPNGLDKPVGSSLGALTGVGKPMTIFDPNATSTRVQQFSFDVQRQLASGLVASVGYSGSRTSNLTWTTASLNMNQLDPRFFSQGAALTQAVPNPFAGRPGAGGVIGGATVARNQLLRPYPQFSSVNFSFSDRNRAQYDSMAIRVQKNMSNGLSFLTTYTLSKNFDLAGGGPGNNLNAGNSGPQDVYSFDGEWGLSYLHSPHRLTNAITYELPVGKGKAQLGSANYVTNLVLGGWSVNAVTTLQTGFPLQVYMNNNGNGALGTARQRPNATGVSPEVGGDFGPRIDNWINKAAFTEAAAFTFGNVTRTLGMRGPGTANWDISIFKTAQILESLKVQFRAEALNAMNTPLFRAPNTAFGNAAFGRITSQGNFPRMIQLGMRIFF
ncbi:MAG: hypothetical protein JNK87_42045, partial [Bryobacterales bacterium]|nr:hypothetical protein [Bryobacterales bacterium]